MYPEMVMLSLAVYPKSNAHLTAASLTSAAVWAGFGVMSPISVKRVYAQVSTAVTASTTAPQVVVKSRPTYGSASGAVTLGTVIIPNSAAVGAVYYKDIADNVRVQAGYELSLEVSVAAADSGTAGGAAFIGCLYEMAPDSDVNQSLLIKSA